MGETAEVSHGIHVRMQAREEPFQLEHQSSCARSHKGRPLEESAELALKFPLSEDVMEKYMCGNAARLLKVTIEPISPSGERASHGNSVDQARNRSGGCQHGQH